jgi:hypothetical protein
MNVYNWINLILGPFAIMMQIKWMQEGNLLGLLIIVSGIGFINSLIKALKILNQLTADKRH